MTSLHLFALTASRRPNYFFNPAFANTGAVVTSADEFANYSCLHFFSPSSSTDSDMLTLLDWTLDRVSDDRLDHECVSTPVEGELG